MGLVPLVLMVLSALLPFALSARLVDRGRNGPAVSVIAGIGAALVILIWAAAGHMGLDPLMAMSWAMLCVLPAFLGALIGAALGWLMRRRRERDGV